MAYFYNQASLSFNGNQIASNITTGEILETLSVSKTAVSQTYEPGDEIVYVVNIVNSGSAEASGLTLTDDLGAYDFGEPAAELVPLTFTGDPIAYFVNGVPQPAPTVSAEAPLTVTGISVPAEGNATLVYSATVNEYAPLGEGASVTNTATVASPSALSVAGTGEVSASATITAENGAELSIVKSLAPVAIEQNGEATYTFVIRNSGGTAVEARSDVIFTDDFAPVLTNLTAQFNGAPWASGTNYSYSETTGSFASLPGQISVPAATFSQDPTTGVWSVQPGESTLVIKGNLA